MLPYVLLELQAIVDHHPAHLALVPHGFQGSLRLQLEVKEKGKGILCWECEFPLGLDHVPCGHSLVHSFVVPDQQALHVVQIGTQLAAVGGQT